MLLLDSITSTPQLDIVKNSPTVVAKEIPIVSRLMQNVSGPARAKRLLKPGHVGATYADGFTAQKMASVAHSYSVAVGEIQIIMGPGMNAVAPVGTQIQTTAGGSGGLNKGVGTGAPA